MKWQDVMLNPKPAELALVFVLMVVSPFYLMVRCGGEPGLAQDQTAAPGERSGDGPAKSGLVPFRTDDIDPKGLLQVKENIIL